MINEMDLGMGRREGSLSEGVEYEKRRRIIVMIDKLNVNGDNIIKKRKRSRSLNYVDGGKIKVVYEYYREITQTNENENENNKYLC